jgi:hypothetical protein
MHLSLAAATSCSSAVGFSGITAVLATSRLVLETLFSVEFLLTSGEYEL